MKTLAIAAASVAALFVSAPAAAQAPPEGRPVVIRTVDLDLGTAAGRSHLDARIRAAARAACEASPTDLSGQSRAGQCRADVVAAAQARRETMLAARGTGRLLAARR